MWWSSIASAGSTFTPPAATEIASQVDDIYAFLLISSFISFVLLIGGMCWFVIKYRRKTANDKTAYITHNHTLEFLWSFIPFVIFMFVFAWGWVVYHKMRSLPDDALEVHVVAKKWQWRFIYKNGKEVNTAMNAQGQMEPPVMVVPLGRAVKLIMASEKMAPGGTDQTDRPVIHSFYVPAFRTKQDVVPGRYTSIWFNATKMGEFWVFCAEYCGAGHWSMRAKIKVVSNEDFEKWLASEGNANLSLVDKGRNLYTTKACSSCHSIDGTRIVGPSFKGLYGSKQQFDTGTSGDANDDFIRESILDPQAKIEVGFSRPSPMPTFAGQLSEDDINALIEFIKSVK